MSRTTQWRYATAAVIMLIGCRSKDRTADAASGSAAADSVSIAAKVAQTDSAAAATTGSSVSLDTTAVPSATSGASSAAAAMAADLAAGKTGAKPGDRVKESASGDMLLLERGTCRGGCVPYTLRVREDGHVTFTLLGGSKKSTDSIATASVRALLESMRGGGFAALDSAYVQGSPGCGAYAADAPIVVLTTVRAGQTHAVRHDYGCSDAPRLLRQWGAAADSIARTARWLPSTAGKSR